MDTTVFCQGCLSTKDLVLYRFELIGLFQSCFNLKVGFGKNQFEWICKDCVTKLETAIAFKSKVEKTQKFIELQCSDNFKNVGIQVNTKELEETLDPLDQVDPGIPLPLNAEPKSEIFDFEVGRRKRNNESSSDSEEQNESYNEEESQHDPFKPLHEHQEEEMADYETEERKQRSSRIRTEHRQKGNRIRTDHRQKATRIRTENRQKANRIRSKDFCFFCENEVLNFARHITRNHRMESEVQKILFYPKKSVTRKQLLTALRKKGNFITNVSKCIKPIRQSYSHPNRVCLPCENCLGFYAKKHLSKHRKGCRPLVETSKIQEKTTKTKAKTGKAHSETRNTQSETRNTQAETTYTETETRKTQAEIKSTLSETVNIQTETINTQEKTRNTQLEEQNSSAEEMNHAKRKRKLVRWSTEQKAIVLNFFNSHIKSKRPPKRHECEELRSKNPAILHNKDWLKIKVFIQNTYTKK